MRDQRLFVENTRQRISHLIGIDAWEGVDVSRYNDWFHQFEEADCALLGACLLDNLAYRSKAQVLSLFKAALTSNRLLPKDARSDLAIVEALRERRDSGIRLVPVIGFGLPPTKSGPYMLRLLSRELRIREKWMLWAHELESLPANVHTILAVDDFCGSGNQFVTKFLGMPEVAAFRRDRPKCRFVYLAAAAHSDGIKAIGTADATVEVIAGEILTPDYHFFDGTVLDQYQNGGLKDILKQQHESMVKRLGLGGAVEPFGYGELGLTYAFAHGTPNNTLPVFWYDSTEGWISLLDR